ncbi:DUF2971 domain-containing protein [Leptospira sp. 201903074]|uniref:DUF2971 domain-containing protein n=1 Tax=Leptospira abararensis TaxID=2810036 RepID=UPI001965A794|nr:DUF2971 domain-containing protein [Leptospira abararensis]MBM9546639.1 DUF2971 domain-containing protein [Leptospira abararensis]MDF3822673.1 DUF2971 domain-containing protein [Leptospira sp. 96542]
MKELIHRLIKRFFEIFDYKISETILFKYVSGEDYHIDSILKNYFYFSRISEVNDPEDCKINPLLDISDTTYQEVEAFFLRKSHPSQYNEMRQTAKIIYYDVKLRNDYVKNYQKINESDDSRFIKTFKILCLTANFKSKHMWENYAKRNIPLDGFCIGYESIKGEDIKIINKHKKYRVPLKKGQIYVGNQTLDFFLAVQVFYGKDETIPYNPFKSNKDDLTNSYYYKKEKWSSEEEFRILLIDNYTNNQPIQKIEFHPEKLKYIIFGKSCPESTRELVRNAVTQNGNYQNLTYLEASKCFNIIRIKKID